jgi:hypothetical protein
MGMVVNPYWFASTAATGLDSTDKSGDMVLSNGNRTITMGGANSSHVCGLYGKATGKWRYQVTYTTLTANAGATGCGLIEAGMTPNPYVGYDAKSIHCSATGSTGVFTSNATAYTHSGFASGDILDVIADLDANKVWFAKNGVVLNGDPVAGTGGTTMSSMGKAWYPIMLSNRTGDVFTVNFDGGFTYSYTGYSAWGTSTPAATATTFRAARVCIGVGSNGNFSHSYAEAEFMASSGGANILSGATGSASLTITSGAVANHVDGNASTFCAMGNTGVAIQVAGWFSYDLGSSGTRNATHFAIRSRSDGGTQTPPRVNLAVSADNTVFWKLKAGITFAAWSAGLRQEIAL